MRNKIAILMVVAFMIMFAAFLLNGGVSAATNQPQTRMERATPEPTRQMVQMQVLNPQTATAIATVYPTSTPTPSPTLIPDSFAPGGEKEAVSSLWFNRMVGVGVFVGTLWLGYLFYQMRMYEIEKRAEVQKHEIDALAKLKINPRPILSTNITMSDDGNATIKLSNKQEVAKNLVIEFLKSPFNGDERGLAVSRWKTSIGWTQQDIENILDHLGEAGMTTKRQAGKACEWLVVPEQRQLAHIFRISPHELEN